MAVRWKMDKDEFKYGASSYLIDPFAIQAEPGENGRHDVPDIEWMIQDIRKRGQETPVVVRNEGGRPVLVFGYQRLRAIKAINERYPEEHRDIFCIFKQLSKEEAFRANIAENRMRSEVTPVDDAHNIKRLMNVYNYTADQIIDAYFPTLSEGKRGKEWLDAQRWVRERMALIGLTPAAEQAVRDGRVKLHGAIQLNKLKPEEQEQLVSGDGPVKIRDVKKAANAPAPTPRKTKGVASSMVIPGGPLTAYGYQPPAYVRSPAGQSDEGVDIDPDWDNDGEDKASDEGGDSPIRATQLAYGRQKMFRTLAHDMFDEITELFWHPWIDKIDPPELVVLADTCLTAAAQASATIDFPENLLQAMEEYRKARVAG